MSALQSANDNFALYDFDTQCFIYGHNVKIQDQHTQYKSMFRDELYIDFMGEIQTNHFCCCPKIVCLFLCMHIQVLRIHVYVD